jgi:hypothetical protein
MQWRHHRRGAELCGVLDIGSIGRGHASSRLSDCGSSFSGLRLYTASAAETWARSKGATEVEIEAQPLSQSNAYADRRDNDPGEGARINKPSQGAPECVHIKISPSLGYRKNIT